MNWPTMILFIFPGLIGFWGGWHFGWHRGYRAAMRRFGQDMRDALAEVRKETL